MKRDDYLSYCRLLFSFHRHLRFKQLETVDAVREEMSVCAGKMSWNELKWANQLSAEFWQASSVEEMTILLKRYTKKWRSDEAT
jgi:hypothetical protein